MGIQAGDLSGCYKDMEKWLIVYPESTVSVADTSARGEDFYPANGIELGFFAGLKVSQLKESQTTCIEEPDPDDDQANPISPVRFYLTSHPFS